MSILDSFDRTNILVGITAHYNPARIRHLAELLLTLAQYQVNRVDVVIVTNTTVNAELEVLNRLCRETFPRGNAIVQSHPDLTHPFDLGWMHKSLIRERVLGHESDYSHFIYSEDDVRVTFRNFCYFEHYKDELRRHGLIPSFIRVEYSARELGYVHTDNKHPAVLDQRPQVCITGQAFISMPNPYAACYILDRDMATEYVASKSFDQRSSEDVSEMGTLERAAMGLCFERVPQSFNSRWVVPVCPELNTVNAMAWVSHLPNNYADNPIYELPRVSDLIK